MASMAASASDNVRLGDVLSTLRDLGLQPRIDVLCAQLERAGLCASAADGDEGVEVRLGFGGAQ